MSIRRYIDAVEKMNERIVYRGRYKEYASDRSTVVAINPTKLEWERNFPKGAAGVLCTDGMIVVGDGVCLSHDILLGYASVPDENEKYRLQIYPHAAYAELWCENDAWADERYPPVAEVRAYVEKQYGETIEQIEQQIAPAIHRFMPGAAVKAIPLDMSQEPLLQADEAFMAMCRRPI